MLQTFTTSIIDFLVHVRRKVIQFLSLPFYSIVKVLLAGGSASVPSDLQAEGRCEGTDRQSLSASTPGGCLSIPGNPRHANGAASMIFTSLFLLGVGAALRLCSR